MNDPEPKVVASVDQLGGYLRLVAELLGHFRRHLADSGFDHHQQDFIVAEWNARLADRILSET